MYLRSAKGSFSFCINGRGINLNNAKEEYDLQMNLHVDLYKRLAGKISVALNKL
jgi:hypothetical protein